MAIPYIKAEIVFHDGKDLHRWYAFFVSIVRPKQSNPKFRFWKAARHRISWKTIPAESGRDFTSILEPKQPPAWTEPFQRRDLTEIFPG